MLQPSTSPAPGNWKWINNASHQNNKEKVYSNINSFRNRSRRNSTSRTCKHKCKEPQGILLVVPLVNSKEIIASNKAFIHISAHISESYSEPPTPPYDCSDASFNKILHQYILQIFFSHWSSFQESKSSLHEKNDCSSQKNPCSICSISRISNLGLQSDDCFVHCNYLSLNTWWSL